jgi:hypothetical protein
MSAWIAAQQLMSQNTGAGKTGQVQGNVTKKGPGNTNAFGNVTGQKKESRNQTGTMPRQGEGAGRNSGDQQNGRMPVEETITRLGQAGYDISGVQSALQNNDRDAMKEWLREFRTTNPGVVESIEGTGTGNTAAGKERPAVKGTPGPTREQTHTLEKDLIGTIKDWFASFSVNGT